jgi:hypothetical protein
LLALAITIALRYFGASTCIYRTWASTYPTLIQQGARAIAFPRSNAISTADATFVQGQTSGIRWVVEIAGSHVGTIVCGVTDTVPINVYSYPSTNATHVEVFAPVIQVRTSIVIACFRIHATQYGLT